MDYPSVTLTENFDIELLHPCVATVISTSQTIGPINYTVGSGIQAFTFTQFVNTVGQQYSNDWLCTIDYAL